MPLTVRWGRVATVGFLVVLMFPMTRLGCELVEFRVQSYATYAEARASGPAGRGWLPAFMPTSAINIREVHDPDSNAQWLVFDVPGTGAEEIVAAMTPISLYDARRSGVNRPWRAGPGWPPELSRFPVATPRDTKHLAFLRSQDGAFCLAVDRQAERVFAWRCGSVV